VKILHIISGLGVGGAETMLAQLAPRLQQRGFVQRVVSLRGDGPRAQDLQKQGIAVEAFQLSPGWRAAPALLRIVTLIHLFRPQVIQGWMYHGDLVAALAHRLAPGYKERRLFWGIRASNMDDKRYGHLLRWSARLSQWPDLVVANSAAGASHHLRMGYRPRRLEVIPNGVDVDRFRPNPDARDRLRAELAIPADACVAIHVARVDPMKDHAIGMAALGQLPNVFGLFVGEGTETLPLPANARGLGRRADVADLYSTADMILSTSAFGEGFSNALIEGMSSGLLPIASDVGDARAIVGDTGAIVAPGDLTALVHAIREPADMPHDARRMRGVAARNRICDLYSLDRAVDRFAAFYSQYGANSIAQPRCARQTL